MSATLASTGEPTPPSHSAQADNYASYVPHDLQYSAEFEDSLIDLLVPEGASTGGIRVVADDGEVPPLINEDELPLSLNDPRRKYTSPIPGINLTHMGGYLEGGPGLDPEMDTFPDDFLSNNPSITTEAQLQSAVQREIDASMVLLKQRVEARRKAKERNEGVEKELRALVEQHEMELRIQERMQEEQRKKKEAKELRRKDRGKGEGG